MEKSGVPDPSAAPDLAKETLVVTQAEASPGASRSVSHLESVDLEKADVEQEKSGTAIIQPVTDPDIVDWDGPDDPEKALNWPASKKWVQIFTLSLLTLLTPWGSSMLAPGVPDVMREFKSTNVNLESLVVSIYILGYAFGPLVIAPLSELYGRLPLYHANTVLFLVFNIACAKSTSLSMLIVFRFLAGLAGSCPITIGSGSIADCFRQEERGRVLAMWTFPVLFGPSVGPVVGSYLSSAAGWRWDFWFLVIWTGVMIVMCVLCLRETYPPILLERKTRRLRKETGNPALRSALQSSRTPMELLLLSVVRPTKMLFLSPIVFGLSLYVAVSYGYLYLVFTTMTEIFETQYGINARNVGLTYLGTGVGQLLALVVFGAVSDPLLKRMAKGGEMKPEYRLPFLWVGAVLVPAGLLLYGWTAQYKVHYMVPVIGTSLLGFGMIGTFMPITTYLVDAYTIYAASAVAANTVLRSLGGAVLPLCGTQMYDRLGLGWGNSLLAFISLAMTPMIWVFLRYGESIRKHPRFQLQL